MKRLVVLVAGVAAMMLVAAVAFAGGSRNGATSAATEYGATWAITLTISPKSRGCKWLHHVQWRADAERQFDGDG